MNGRMVWPIFTCSDFGKRRPNEEIEQDVDTVKKRDPDIFLAAADLQTAHRLQGDDKVNVRFSKQYVTLFTNAASSFTSAVLTLKNALYGDNGAFSSILIHHTLESLPCAHAHALTKFKLLLQGQRQLPSADKTPESESSD